MFIEKFFLSRENTDSFSFTTFVDYSRIVREITPLPLGKLELIVPPLLDVDILFVRTLKNFSRGKGTTLCILLIRGNECHFNHLILVILVFVK